MILKNVFNGISWTVKIITLIAIIAVASSIYFWFKKPEVVTRTEYVQVPVEKIVTKIKRVEVPVTKIVTYEKEVIVEKLKLPDWIKTDANKQVIADAEIPAYEGKTSAVAVLDTKSGNAEIVAKQKPLPFFAFANTKEIGMRYGYNSALKQQADIYARWTFMRVGSVRTSLYGEVNSKPEGKVMLDVRVEFK